MNKFLIQVITLMKNVGKHKRDKKNLTTDETQKSVFENQFIRDKTCFSRNETHLTRNEIHFRKEIMKSSGETCFVSQEMKPVSSEMTPVTREIFFISLMFFSDIHTKINNSNIIIN
ncbi:MAG: hypothetical protein LBL13_05645 [Bacteroidales bacterium]|jgi:hypothetical protein|nr:hypothetical protein [Bacteroidales bacterium]